MPHYTDIQHYTDMSRCQWCDAPLAATTKRFYFYTCGRIILRKDHTAGFTCVHEGRKDKTRCSADNGRRPMRSFQEYLESLIVIKNNL